MANEKRRIDYTMSDIVTEGVILRTKDTAVISGYKLFSTKKLDKRRIIYFDNQEEIASNWFPIGLLNKSHNFQFNNISFTIFDNNSTIIKMKKISEFLMKSTFIIHIGNKTYYESPLCEHLIIPFSDKGKGYRYFDYSVSVDGLLIPGGFGYRVDVVLPKVQKNLTMRCVLRGNFQRPLQ